jgi:predicted AAA+ superfamily ATPase
MKLIPRKLSGLAPSLRRGYPAIAITGPRQSGKTTFARAVFADLPYANLESPTERADLETDPVGFLDRFPDGAVLDEVHQVPDAFSHLQVRIDADGRMGRWVLTGSQQLDLGRHAAQTLAGRVALLELLPFSFAEVRETGTAPRTPVEAVFRGDYPPLYDLDRELDPVGWLENYVSTFVARDVRSVVDVRNRSDFDRFLRLCAGRTGQLLNVAELARDVGVDNKTISAWISVLEACYVVRLLRPHHRNFGKRLIKSPKLYFLDSGLACRLLHITDTTQLRLHPLWGELFETWCVSELWKGRVHRGLPADLRFWRTSDGHEVDVVLDLGTRLVPIEIKATATPGAQLARGLDKLQELAGRAGDIEVTPGIVVYGGSEARPAGKHRLVPWTDVDSILEPSS